MKSFPCNTKLELEKRERYYIENFECVNKSIPTRTKKEYLPNIIKIKKKNMIESITLKIKIKKNKYSIDYQNKNKEKILAKKKEEYQKKKELKYSNKI